MRGSVARKGVAVVALVGSILAAVVAVADDPQAAAPAPAPTPEPPKIDVIGFVDTYY